MSIEEYSPTGFALKIFKDRYAIHAEETFIQACERVAIHISNAELGNKREQYKEQFINILKTNRFSPGGRIWRGAGRPRGQMLNCFVYCDDNIDSREGWGDTLRAVTIISGTGGGVGINFSKIRPRGTAIRGTGGEATGAVSLMRCINAVCNELREGGGRRCLPKDTLIHTDHGLIKISDLELHHMVQTISGKFSRIIAKEYTGKKRLIEIDTQMGVFCSSGDHRWAVMDDLDGGVKWVEAKHLKSQDRLVFINHGINGIDTELPNYEYVKPKHATTTKQINIPELNEKIAWFFGQLHGDGHVRMSSKTARGSVSVACSDDLPEQHERVTEAMCMFGKELNVSERHTPNERCSKPIVTSIQLSQYLSQFKKSNTSIDIPQFILCGNKTIRSAYLAGLLDADGYLGRTSKLCPVRVATSVYPDFMRQARAILSSLCIVSSIKIDKSHNRPKHWKQLYHLDIVGIESIQKFIELVCPFSSKYKRDGIKTRKKEQNSLTVPSGMLRDSTYRDSFSNTYWQKKAKAECSWTKFQNEVGNKDFQPIAVRSIKYTSNEEDTYDIQILDDEMFVAEGMLVHNSALMYCLKYDHPDLLEFMEAKLDNNELNNANISVCIDNTFLKLLDAKEDIVFKWHGEELGRIAAQDIWDKIVRNAWESGDPGLLNIGLANEMNTISYKCELVSTNPCFTKEMRLQTKGGLFTLEQLHLLHTENDVVTDDRCVNDVLLGTTIRHASAVQKTGSQKQIYKMTTSHGHIIRCTEYHEFMTQFGRRPLSLLSPGLEINLQSGEGSWGTIGDYEDGLIVGSFTGDGTTFETDSSTLMILSYWDEDILCSDILKAVNHKIANTQLTLNTRDYGPLVATVVSGTDQKRISSIRLSRYFQQQFGADITTFKECVPEMVWMGSKELVKGYLAGLFQADGSVQLKDRGTKGSLSVRLSQSNQKLLQDIQMLLGNFGIVSSVYKRRDAQYRNLPDGKGGLKQYWCKTQYELVINRPNAIVFEQRIGFAGDKQTQLATSLDKRGRECRKSEKFITKIDTIVEDGVEDVYCLNEPETHSLIVNGFVTGNCGEQWLSHSDCCNLGAINLHSHIIDGKMDWDLLEETVAIGVRFLDNVLDQNTYPLAVIQETSQRNRRIGLGVMGLHDMLLEFDLKYSSQEAIDFVDKLMNCIKKQAYHASIRIAIEKGSFHSLDVNEHIKTGFAKKCLTRNHRRLIKEHGIRNCALLCIAPTGTTSIVAGCSSGIEPLFQPVYKRMFNEHKNMHNNEKRDGSTEIVVHPLLAKFLRENRSTEHFQGAHDITPKEHLAMQSVCQKHIDNSISKTINVPNNYPIESLSKDLRESIGDLKGITIYRDGSRGQSPLVPVPLLEAKKYLEKIREEAAVNDCPSGACETQGLTDKDVTKTNEKRE